MLPFRLLPPQIHQALTTRAYLHHSYKATSTVTPNIELSGQMLSLQDIRWRRFAGYHLLNVYHLSPQGLMGDLRK